ncbi:3-dehydroquinate synthase [Lentibacillus halodurans]|uniref:3-dehydroquinate synthase n=1 Tax=Lentibacillus halodurans TaxID=237679 RepID=A0A1I0VCR2_9BACI|nr:3-dehydroquinate synthase [Lentibacillus halodurans]SFA73833.1 3-dehydroquinate synthase [Lentibacillus halodurans]
MNESRVKAKTHTYPVYIGENLRYQTDQYLPKSFSSIFIITDETVAAHYLQDVQKSLANETIFSCTIPAGEQSKNIDTFYHLHTKAIEYGLDRQSLIIALGGGVVGDVAGFVAATFMRGIDFIQMPTTILAHDSSVGGKVAINHAQGKNLIGNFYAPASVIYDVQTLHTLNDHELRSGYAELLKESLLADKELYHSLIITDLSFLTSDKLIEQLTRGIDIKAEIVEIDEHESGVRKYLNLGHTLGHALETILGYGSWTHGELVAIGLLFAIRVSEKTYAIQLPYEQLYTWLKDNDYPLQLPYIDPAEILAKMKKDKKTLNTTIQMVLLQDIARPALMEISDKKLLNYLYDFQIEMKQRSE